LFQCLFIAQQQVIDQGISDRDERGTVVARSLLCERCVNQGLDNQRRRSAGIGAGAHKIRMPVHGKWCPFPDPDSSCTLGGSDPSFDEPAAHGDLDFCGQGQAKSLQREKLEISRGFMLLDFQQHSESPPEAIGQSGRLLLGFKFRYSGAQCENLEVTPFDSIDHTFRELK